MLIDLHTHTRYGSGCSILDIDDLVDQAIKVGLDAVCVTDHNTMKVVDRVRKAGRSHGLIVIGGMELRCLEGDVLIFGLDGFIQRDLKPGTPAAEAVKLVHNSGGVAIPAHPFRASAPSLGDRVFEIAGLDALEVKNGNSKDEENGRALQAAESLRLPGTGGSDAHSRENVGRCMTRFEDDSICDEESLIAALKGGRFRAAAPTR